jgi:hypothetical protein
MRRKKDRTDKGTTEKGEQIQKQEKIVRETRHVEKVNR